MDIGENTRLSDILAAYPWLPDALIARDGRFRVVRTPLGKMLVKSATLGQACRKAGYAPQDALRELQKLIAAHENS